MLYVVQLEIETSTGEEKTDIKVFQSLKDAEKRWYAAWDILEGRRREKRGTSVFTSSLFEVEASDVRDAARLAREGSARLIRSDRMPFGEEFEASLDEMLADLPVDGASP